MARIQYKRSTKRRPISKPKAEMLKRLRFAARQYEMRGEGGIL